jgi:hypothetical protein
MQANRQTSYKPIMPAAVTEIGWTLIQGTKNQNAEEWSKLAGMHARLKDGDEEQFRQSPAKHSLGQQKQLLR